jgi:hypothetical protein
MKKISLILAAGLILSGCANKDYDRYLQAKIAMAQQPQRVIAEMNGVKIYDQRPVELAPPQQQWWIPLLTTLITVSGQTVLGVSGNNTQAEIVRALAGGVGNVNSYFSQDTITGSYNTDSSSHATDNSVSVRLRQTDQSQHSSYTDAGTSYTDASQKTETSATDNSVTNTYTDASSTQTTEDTRNSTWY